MLRIRKGEEKDLPAIAALLVDTWKNCYADFLPSSFLENLDSDQQLLRHRKIFQHGASYLVAETETGRLIGFASFGIPRFEELDTKVELYTLYVDRHFQNSGIGRQLLEATLTIITDIGPSISVLVMDKNPYRHFYEKNGFVQTGSQPMDLGGFSVTNIVYRK